MGRKIKVKKQPNDKFMLPQLIAILPPAPVDKRVKALKQWVIERCGYIAESYSPPHITLNLNKFPDPTLVDKELGRFCASFPPVEVTANGLDVFPGETTVVKVHIEKNRALEVLQEGLSKKLAPLHTGEHVRELGSHLTTEQIRVSEQYGYPYVGRGWIPHMTIAFFDKENFEKAGKELLTKGFNKTTFTTKEIILLLLQRDKDRWNWKPFRVYPLGTQVE